MRIHALGLAAYGVLIAVIAAAFLLAEVTWAPSAWLVVTVGTVVGVLAATHIHRVSYTGVAIVVFLSTVVAPIALIYTWGWQIASSAFSMGAQSVSSSMESNSLTLSALPLLAGLMSLWGTRRLTTRWSER